MSAKVSLYFEAENAEELTQLVLGYAAQIRCPPSWLVETPPDPEMLADMEKGLSDEEWDAKYDPLAPPSLASTDFADFPRDLKQARELGELMATGERCGAVMRMGLAATALAICARNEAALSLATRVSGLDEPRVSAFYDGYKSVRR